MKIELLGGDEFAERLAKLKPATNRRILVRSLTESAMAVARNAADVQIKRGGRVAVGSTMTSSPPLRDRLTSRSGRLRGSLAGANYRGGLRTGGLPRYIEVGTRVVYAAVHEFGRGPFPVRAFLGPALEAVAKTFRQIFDRNWRREARIR